VIVLDASVLIAFLSSSDAHHGDAVALLSATPPPYGVHPLTMAETLVGPARRGVQEDVLADLAALGVRVDDESMGADASLELAGIRADLGLKMPDACVLWLARRRAVGLATFDSRLAGAALREGRLHS
jgi:predicted nucleic acid-binding protein